MLDLAIIGGGPAALSAAIYATRAGLKTTVFERKNLGGTLAEIDQISNYPGFLGAGKDLGENFLAGAKTAGAKLSYGECTEIAKLSEYFELTIDEEKISAKTVLVATGSEPLPLDFSIEKPVSYCALCDGDLVKDKDIAVVGGANSALQEAFYLAELAKSVTIITHSTVKADQKLQERLESFKNLSVREQTEPTAALLNTFDHVFVYIGRRPATGFVKSLVELDEAGYIVTGKNQKFSHMASVAGLFVAGDVRSGAIRQVITATADGAAAALEISQYIKG